MHRKMEFDNIDPKSIDITKRLTQTSWLPAMQLYTIIAIAG